MNYLTKVSRSILVSIICMLLLSGCPDGEEGGVADPRNILSEIELSVFEQVNQYRVDQGLPPLTLDTNIVTQARNHSRNMAEGTVQFGHEGLQERVTATGIKLGSFSENVAYYQEIPDVATTVVKGWLNSEAHHRNIVGDFNLTGVGVLPNGAGRYYFTQIFIRSSETAASGLSWLQFWNR